MRGDEIWNDSGAPSVLGADLVELIAQSLKELERRLGDVLEHLVLGMFWSHLHSAGSVVKNQSLEVRLGSLVHKAFLIEEQIVTDPAADVGMAYSRHGIDLPVQLKHLFVRAVHIRTRSRKQTGFPAAFVAKVRVLATHHIHIGRRGPEIGDIPRKAWHLGQFPNLSDYGLLRTGLDELTLMRGDGAEITSSEAPSVSDDGILDHVIGRDPLPLVARMRQLGERQVPERVHLLGRGR